MAAVCQKVFLLLKVRSKTKEDVLSWKTLQTITQKLCDIMSFQTLCDSMPFQKRIIAMESLATVALLLDAIYINTDPEFSAYH